jgi:hypothetical protein
LAAGNGRSGSGSEQNTQTFLTHLERFGYAPSRND